MSEIAKEKIIKSFVSLSLGQYGGMLCNITLSIWLTRILSPKEFGMLAIALFYFIFFNWIVEWGWEQGFMAHKEIPLEKAASTHFWIRCILGLVPLITFGVGYIFFHQYSFMQHGDLFLPLAGIYWMEKLGLTYRTILERTYRLDMLAGLEFITTVGSYIVAIIAAFHGFGVYSLVLQRLVEKGLISLAYFFASPWKIGFDFDLAVAKLFFKTYGLPTWLGGIFSLTIYDFMPFLIGILSNTTQAGLYAKAFSMATFPVMLTGIFARLTVPLYTRYQFDREEMKKIFVNAQGIKMILLIPTQLAMGLFAHLWIPKLFGAQWLPMIPIYQMMTVYGIARAFFDDVPAIYLYGLRQPWVLTKSQILQSCIILLLGPLLVLKLQAFGGACAISAMLTIAAVLFWRDVFFDLECGLRDFVIFFVMLPRTVKSSIHVLISKTAR